jgi:RecB family exonuclease
MFREVAEASLARWNLSAPEAAVERTRLLGSPVAAGLGEAVFLMEIERPVAVVDRVLEFRLDGEFVFETTAGPRVLPLRGKADRIDLLADGTFRLIDYKLGWPPNRARALQLPIYALCAEQRLSGYLGRHWTLGEAAYVAFKGPKRVVGLFASDGERSRVLADAQQRLVDTADAIGAGRFPPAPDDVFRCETCAYGLVCRKDYVGEL